MYKIPTDYESIFRDRLLIITGVSRSGTSILGKLIGSMKPVYYLYEPAIMKYMPFEGDTGTFEDINQTFKAILFEDYFLPQIQGRNLNSNPNDETYYRHYFSPKEVMEAHLNLSRRNAALEYVKEWKPLFVIKINEAQPLFNRFRAIFPGVQFIHIVRNGNEVIQSINRMQWYSHAHMSRVVDWIDDDHGMNVPWYLENADKELWGNWGMLTRAACVWRTLVDMAFSNHVIKYETLLVMPIMPRQIVIDWWLHIGETRITFRHIKAVKAHKKTEYPNVVEAIEEPEKEKFKATMKRLGY